MNLLINKTKTTDDKHDKHDRHSNQEFYNATSMNLVFDFSSQLDQRITRRVVYIVNYLI